MSFYSCWGKRLMDLIFAVVGIVFFLPVVLLAGVLIIVDSGFPVFFLQKRIGKYGKVFVLLKLRTMYVRGANGGRSFDAGDSTRITPVGKVLRKTKIDELPQLFNVFLGQMSVVGPRPEVPEFRNFYIGDNEVILRCCPGITDLASIKYRNEEELLLESPDPDSLYRELVLPDKLVINRTYAEKNPTFIQDFGIIVDTLIILCANYSKKKTANHE